MKKLFRTILSFLLVVCAVSPCMTVGAESLIQTYATSEFDAFDNIIQIDDTTMTDISYDKASLDAFMAEDGIIIVKHQEKNTAQIESILNMSVSISEPEQDNNQTVDVATLYYMCDNGIRGTYIVNMRVNDSFDPDVLIAEAIEDIREQQCQLVQPYSAVPLDPLGGTSSASADCLDIITVTTTVLPKGKLTARYYVYTIQDYKGYDFYIIKANITGIPGCVLGKEDSSYKKAYKIENMKVSMGALKTNTDLNSYGPHRTINSKSYSVDIGLSFDTEKTYGINGGWSYSRTINDTTIEASTNGKKASWDIALEDDARKTSFTFEPTAAFMCPSSSPNTVIEVSASCILDSWYAFEETLSSTRKLTCSSSKVTSN